ncbi:MAG: PAS domain S-box protein [Rhodothermales bacterium]
MADSTPPSTSDALPNGAALPDDLALFLDFLDQFSVGVSIYHLDDPDDPGSLRLVHANDAASRAVGFDVKAEIGKTFNEALPQALETDIPATYAEVALTGERRDLGEVEYGDERVQRGTFRVEAVPLPGRHVGVIFEEVTQRKATEDRLRLLTAATENARDSILITGPEIDEPGPVIVYANSAFTRLTGYELHEVVGKTPRLLQGPDTDRTVIDRLRARLEAGETFSGETINYRKDGTPFVMSWDIAPIHGGSGEITHWVATQRDVTERRQAEERLRQSEAELRSIAEATFEGVVLSEGGRIVLVNETFAEMMGYAPDELVGMNPAEEGYITVAAESHAEVQARIEAGFEGAYEAVLRRKDGSTFPAEIRARMIRFGGRDVRATAVRDVTERVATLEATRRQALRFRGIFDSAFQHIFLLRPDGTLVEANRTALDFAGVAAEEVVGEPIWEARWWGLNPRTRERLAEAVERAAEGDLVRYVVDVSGQGDRVAALDLSVKPVADEHGRVELLIAEGRDITEDVRTEQELRRLQETQRRLALEEARYRLAARATNDAIWDWDLTTDEVKWNPAVADLFGWTDAVDGTDAAWWKEHIHPEDRERVVVAIHDVIEGGGETWRSEYRFRRADGTYADVYDRGYMERDDEGEPRRMVGAMQDVTERKQAEVAVRTALRHAEEAEQRKTEILESIGDAFFSLDTDWHFTYVNEQAGPLLQRDPDDLVGKNVWEAFPEALDSAFGQHYQRAVETGEVVAFDAYYPPLERHFAVRAYPYPGGLSVYFSDVTAQKEAEQALREVEERFRLATDAAQIGTWDYNPISGALEWDARCKAIFGIAPGVQADYDVFLERLHPDDHAATNAAVEGALDPAGSGMYDAVYRVFQSDGDVRWIHATGKGFFEGEGDERHAVRLIGTVRDITEEREAAEAVRRSEAQLLSLVDNLPELAWSARPDGHIEFYNHRWYEYTGTTPEQMEGWGWKAVHHPDHLDDVVARWQHSIDAGEAFEMEFPLRAADGSFRWFLTRIRPLRDDDGEITRWVGTNTDIDEHRRLLAERDEALARAETSEARYRFLGETLRQQVWTAEPDGQLDYVNSYVVEFFGRSAEEVIGAGWQAVVHPEDLPLVAERWAHSVSTGEPYEVEFRLRRHDGAYRWHLARANAHVDDGEVVKWFGANTDIQEKKEAEEVLTETNRVLERRVAERTQALEGFSEDLKALHRITSAEHDRTEDFFHDYLRAGCDIFEMPIGILSETPLLATGERVYRVHAAESAVAGIEAGMEIPLRDAFCDAVVGTEQTMSYGDTAEVEALACHSAYTERGLRSFIGTPVWVDGELFGTLNFISPEPRPSGFAPHEHELVEVIAELVGRLLSQQRAERARAETDARYRSVVRTIDEGLILVDAEGRVLMSNPAATQFLGLEEGTHDSLTGSGRYTIVRPDGSPFPEAELPEREVLHTGQAVSGVIQGIVSPRGGTRWYSVNARAAEHDDEGAVRTVVVSFTDVTEQRQAETELRESEAQLQNAQQIAHIGSWKWHVADDEIQWSDELFRIFGLVPDAFDPSFESYLNYIHPEDRDTIREGVAGALERGGGFEVNHRIVQPDGTVRYVLGLGEAVLDDRGEIVALQGTAQDVTQQHEAERAMQRYADDLEERNAELEQFAYVASHDLQEPLRMVSSFLQLLQRRYADQLDETADEYIAYAVDGAKRMQVLIQDLLAYSRVGTRGKAFRPVDMNRTVETILTDLGPALDDVDADVRVEPLPTVSADETQMRQLLQNLVANAVKFRGEATPEVRVSAARIREDDRPLWRFAVADNGIGIEAHHADRVFQIFQRLHTRDEYEGTGIGLAMCKKIVERHGGRIWFESEPGAGTTFYFTIPDQRT